MVFTDNRKKSLKFFIQHSILFSFFNNTKAYVMKYVDNKEKFRGTRRICQVL